MVLETYTDLSERKGRADGEKFLYEKFQYINKETLEGCGDFKLHDR
jgi:hypothetical protein